MLATKKHIHVTISMRVLAKIAEMWNAQGGSEVAACAPSQEAILALLSQLYGKPTYSDYSFCPPFFRLEACFGPIEDAEVSLADLGESEALMEVALSRYLPGNDLVIDGLGVRYVT